MFKLLLGMVFICVTLSSYANNFMVNDPVQHLQLKGRQVTVSYMIVNRDKKSVSFDVTPDTMLIGKKGTRLKDKALSDQTSNYAITASSIKRISPKRLRIKPGKSRQFRVFVNTSAFKNDGTYYANIKVAQRPPKKNPILNKIYKAGETGAQLNVLINNVVSFYLTKGKGNAAAAQITCHINAKTNAAELKVKNATAYLFHPKITLSNASQATIDEVRPIPVMPYSEGIRTLILPKSYQRGPLTATVQFLSETSNNEVVGEKVITCNA